MEAPPLRAEDVLAHVASTMVLFFSRQSRRAATACSMACVALADAHEEERYQAYQRREAGDCAESCQAGETTEEDMDDAYQQSLA